MPAFRIGDYVQAREFPGSHSFPGTVVGRTFGRPPHRYDVRDIEGRVATNVAEIWPDEPRFSAHRSRLAEAQKELT